MADFDIRSVNAFLYDNSSPSEDGAIRIVSNDCCRRAADLASTSRLQAEIVALELGICPARYERSIGTLGLAGQKKLLKSAAVVAGAGGLGGLIVELLARAGVGRITVADGDTFSENNLNRQLLCRESDIGRSKAEAAQKRVSEINGAVEITALNEFITAENVARIAQKADVAIDALDNNGARRLVWRHCQAQGIPFVHGAIGGVWAQAALFLPGDSPPWETTSDLPDRGVEQKTGNPPFTPAMAASIEAAIAIEYLAGIKLPKNNTLHWFDLSDLSVMHLPL